MQKNAAWIVHEAPRWSHASRLPRTLHWLPVQQRIDYKVALLTFKVRSTSTLSDLRRLIQDRQHSHNLRPTTTDSGTLNSGLTICCIKLSFIIHRHPSFATHKHIYMCVVNKHVLNSYLSMSVKILNTEYGTGICRPISCLVYTDIKE